MYVDFLGSAHRPHGRGTDQPTEGTRTPRRLPSCPFRWETETETGDSQK